MFKKIVVMIFVMLSILISGAKTTFKAHDKDIKDTETTTVSVDEREYAVRYSYMDLLEEYYNEYYEYSESQFTDIEEMTFEEFHDYFYDQDEMSISNYIIFLKNTIDVLVENTNDDYIGNYVTLSSSSGSNRAWYYDVGTKLPQKPKYGKFNFSSIWAGDILYEDAGFGGLTVHIAIIEGNFYDTGYNVDYWRIIESVMPGGVCRGVLDDDRFVDRKGHLLYVPSSTPANREMALYFVKQQLGKPYALQPFTKPTSINHPRWQCSTLVWAGYMYAGIDIEKSPGGEPGVTPHDIRDAKTTTQYLRYK